MINGRHVISISLYNSFFFGGGVEFFLKKIYNNKKNNISGVQHLTVGDLLDSKATRVDHKTTQKHTLRIHVNASFHLSLSLSLSLFLPPSLMLSIHLCTD